LIGDKFGPELSKKDGLYIWCHADAYARRHKLTGLVSGMFISEVSEAAMNGIRATQEEVDASNNNFSKVVRGCLDIGSPLAQVRQCYTHAECKITRFNQERLYVFEHGVPTPALHPSSASHWMERPQFNLQDPVTGSTREAVKAQAIANATAWVKKNDRPPVSMAEIELIRVKADALPIVRDFRYISICRVIDAPVTASDQMAAFSSYVKPGDKVVRVSGNKIDRIGIKHIKAYYVIVNPEEYTELKRRVILANRAGSLSHEGGS
jgi:hypothetical protein